MSTIISIFINDLPLHLEGPIRCVDLCADDTALYDIAADKNIPEKNLKHALDLLNAWCLENDMLLNKDETKLMLTSSQQKKYYER